MMRLAAECAQRLLQETRISAYLLASSAWTDSLLLAAEGSLRDAESFMHHVNELFWERVHAVGHHIRSGNGTA